MILVQLLLLAFSRACAFNIDTQAPIVRSGAHPTDAKYFGYSVAPYANAEGKWILVGAPLDDSDGMERFGALYRCKLAKDSKCEPFTGYPDPIRELDPLSPGVWRDRDHVHNQWLGVSVAANPNGIIVTCAHRYVDFRANFQRYDPIGRCFLFNSTFHIRPVLAPCKNRTEGIYGFSFCQSGSDVALANDGKQILLGNPGTFNWAGNMDIVNSSDYKTVALSYASDVGSSEIGYVAYSVAFGSFKFYESTNEFVVGAPRSMGYTGRVIVLRETSVGRVSVSVAKRGSQVGAYFGHSVVAVDLNRDGYDDLVVGAPYYTGQLRDQGQVYTYINTQNNDFMLDRILTGPLARGAFGYAIATVGDVNLDGFTDIVIGAPFADDPTVYLYTTSLNGLVASPLQVIPSSSLNLNFSMLGFGAALAGGVDLDGNSYADIVVGAFRSEKAVVLRSKPVAAIVATLDLSPQFLNYPNITDFEAKLCLRYTGIISESNLNVNYDIEVDKVQSDRGFIPRAWFNDTANLAKKGGTITVPACKTFSLTLRSQITKLVTLVTVDVTYRLPSEPKLPTSGGNPFIRALPSVLRKNANNSPLGVSESAYLLRGCRLDFICVPDLRLKNVTVTGNATQEEIASVAPLSASMVALGLDASIRLRVLVENLDEAAYAAKVSVTFSKELTLERVLLRTNLIVCSNETRDNNMIRYTCDIGNPLNANQEADLNFVLLLAGLSLTTKEFSFTVEAQSTNPEKNTTLDDNTVVTPPIQVIKRADFGLQGTSKPPQVPIDPANPFGSGLTAPETIKEAGRQVNISYFVRNRGPSPIPETIVSITWPQKTTDNRYLLYLTDVDVNGPAQCNAEEPSLLNAGDLKEPTPSSNRGLIPTVKASSRGRREADQCGAEGVYETACSTFQCKVSGLSSGEKVEIRLRTRLFENTLLQDRMFQLNLSSEAVINFDSASDPVPFDTGPKTLPKRMIVTTEIISAEKTVEEEEREPWVIPVVVVLSLLFLALVIALMVWRGFFRRPAKEKLEEEKEELEHLNSKEKMIDVNGDGSEA
ncbi:integrin alpha-V-like [Oscarella lobularis]|uniref:integrin alpha-V-like n=1 Tax=Oscarella lobularis TaxID=121494 RepID=UPI0033143243